MASATQRDRWLDLRTALALKRCGTADHATLLASLLLLGQVLLAARIPLLEHAFGQRHLIALHRGTGVASFAGMLAHVGCASWAHGPAGAGRVPAGFWQLTWTRPGMVAASLGTVLVVLVVVTSARWIRTRLRYEWWHLLHLWGYAGVFLALPHQLWAGREFTTSPSRTVAWVQYSVPSTNSCRIQGLSGEIGRVATNAAVSARVRRGDTVAVVGDGAVGLCAVLAAKRLGAERIILLGRHTDRTDLGREFGATDVVAERGDENPWKSFANLPEVHVLSPGELNAYDVLVCDYIVFTRATLPSFSTPAPATPAPVEPAAQVDTDPSGEEEE